MSRIQTGLSGVCDRLCPPPFLYTVIVSEALSSAPGWSHVLAERAATAHHGEGEAGCRRWP